MLYSLTKSPMSLPLLPLLGIFRPQVTRNLFFKRNHASKFLKHAQSVFLKKTRQGLTKSFVIKLLYTRRLSSMLMGSSDLNSMVSSVHQIILLGRTCSETQCLAQMLQVFELIWCPPWSYRWMSSLFGKWSLEFSVRLSSRQVLLPARDSPRKNAG